MLKVKTGAVLGVVIAGVLMSGKLNAGAADPVTLVKERTPASTIVVGKNLPAAEVYAAQELQKYLSKISGAQIPIREEGGAVAGCKILLGTFESNGSIKALQDQLKQVESLGDEGFLITTMDGNLVIAGGGTAGVLYGVYTFLEKDLGCRWYFPGDAGEVIPKRGTIELGAISRSEQPSFSYRGLVIGNVPGNHQYDQGIIDWMARNKMNSKTQLPHVLGIGIDPSHPKITMTQYEGMRSRAVTPSMISHTFWWLVPADQYYDKHPEYFPLIKGKRVRPDNPGSVYVQLCLSNPEVLAICVEKTRALFAKYPEIQTMGISPNDNATGIGWCDCDQCKAMGKTRTDQLMTFVNRVAAEIQETNPGKSVGFFAYTDCEIPPTVKPLDNVRVQFVRNWRCYKHTLNDPKCEDPGPVTPNMPSNAIRAREIKAWLKVIKPDHFTWGDYSDPWEDLPLPAAGVLTGDLKWFHELGMAGSTVTVTPGSWDMVRLNTYVTAKVSWDTNLKYEDILDDYCKNLYGPASAPMKKYHQALDRAVQDSPGCVFLGDVSNAESFLTPQVLRELKGYLLEAQRLAAEDSNAAPRISAAMAAYGKWVVATLGQVDVDTEGGKNMVANPGFEEGQTGWNAAVQRGKYDVAIDPTQAHEGKASAKIACIEPGHSVWQQVVPVEKGKNYYFSIWVKGEGKPLSSTVVWLDNVQNDSPRNAKRAALGNGQGGEIEGQWKKYIIPEITPLENQLTITLQGDGPGAVWFDDLVLRKVGD